MTLLSSIQNLFSFFRNQSKKAVQLKLACGKCRKVRNLHSNHFSWLGCEMSLPVKFVYCQDGGACKQIFVVIAPLSIHAMLITGLVGTVLKCNSWNEPANIEFKWEPESSCHHHTSYIIQKRVRILHDKDFSWLGLLLLHLDQASSNQ